MPDYAAFISYSHASDRPMVEAFEQVLQGLGKRWWSRRAVWVFRDDMHLSATPELWPSIVVGLESSRAFVLLATPQAAQSIWVQKEIDWWLEHRGVDQLFVALLDGTLEWDGEHGRFSEASNAFPPNLREAFAHEPKYIDLRHFLGRNRRDLVRDPDFQSRTGDIAAALNGKPKAELMSEELRQQRQLTRVFAVLGAVLLGLLGFAGWQTIAAEQRRLEAEQGQRNAMVGLALSMADENPIDALRLVLAAWPTENEHSFPVASVTFDAVSLALQNTRPHIVLPSGGTMLAVAFSPDGSQIVGAGPRGTIRIWDASTGQETGEPIETDGSIWDIAFSPDGTRIVTGSSNGQVRLWDIVERRVLTEENIAPQDGVASVTFSPDGFRIVSASGDGAVSVLDPESLTPLVETFQPPSKNIGYSNVGVEFSPNGQQMISVHWGGIQLWETEKVFRSGKMLNWHDDWIRSAAWSPNGKYIASADEAGKIQIRDVTAPSEIRDPLIGHEGPVYSLQFSPDGLLLASAGRDRTIRLWDVTTSQLLGVLRGHEHTVWSVAFSPDGTQLASGGQDGTMRIWDVPASGSLRFAIHGQKNPAVMNAIFSPDGNQIASIGDDGSVRVWDAATMEPLLGGALLYGGGALGSLAYSPDGSRIAIGGNSIRLLDAITGKLLETPINNNNDDMRTTSISFSADGTRIVSGSLGSGLQLWDATTGIALSEPFGRNEAEVLGVAFSPTADLVASGSQANSSVAGTLRFWDPTTRMELGSPLEADWLSVVSVAFSPDGRVIVTGGGDGTVRLWDVATRTAIGASLGGHANIVRSVAFSPDGLLIASASTDGTIRLWDATTGASVGSTIHGHQGIATSVAFSPDGSRIVTGGQDGAVRTWLVPVNARNIIQLACDYLPHVDNLPDTSMDTLALELGMAELTRFKLPNDCESYYPQLPRLAISAPIE